MCGLFGSMSYNLTKNEIEATMNLGIMSLFRGMHSTGMIVGAQDRKKGDKDHVNVYTHKAVTDSVNFLLYDQKSEALLTKKNTCFILGHCRHATVGHINQTNAHPIRAGDIIGCHNGTINHYEPDKKDEHKITDSKVLLQKIDEMGIEAALNDAEPGAYAITYVDMRARTVNLVRNDRRPLWIAWNTMQTTLYWASEKAILDYGEDKSSIIMGIPMQLKEHTLMTFNFGDIKPDVTKINIKKTYPVVSHYGGREHYQGSNRGHQVWSARLGRYVHPDYKDWLEENHGKAASERTAFKHTPTTGDETVHAEYNDPLDDDPTTTELKKQAREAAEKAKRDFDKHSQTEMQYDHQSNSFRKRTANDIKTQVEENPELILYRGYMGRPIKTLDAISILSSGCCNCNTSLTLDDKAHWFNNNEFVCDECSNDTVVQYHLDPKELWEGIKTIME